VAITAAQVPKLGMEADAADLKQLLVQAQVNAVLDCSVQMALGVVLLDIIGMGLVKNVEIVHHVLLNGLAVALYQEIKHVVQDTYMNHGFLFGKL